MNRLSQRLLHAWTNISIRYLPFADAASPDLPLSRLLRLSLIQVSVGMALVLLVGTLNRVMIVELSVPASLVAVMLSLPVLAAPFRALIGYQSDTHKSALGWKRVPYIWRGTLIQFGGLAIMPFALLVLAGQGEADTWPVWIGHVSAGLAFLLVGAGLHTTQTVGLALATDQAPVEDQPKVVGLMYVMLLLGMIASALVFGALLQDFTPGRLVQVVQGSAVVTMLLNVVALWKQEAISRPNPRAGQRDPTFPEAWQAFIQGGQALRRLAAIGLGTMAFAMQDVLLEPFGGQVLGLSVAATTLLTACLAGGTLVGFAVASRVLSRGFDPFRMASLGAAIGIPGFVGVIMAAPMQTPPLFALAIVLIGLGAGLFGHGTLTATMQFAPRHQVGLALGAWGAVQATAAGLAVGLGGVIRDLAGAVLAPGQHAAPAGYMVVYALEVALLLATLATMAPLLRRKVATA